MGYGYAEQDDFSDTYTFDGILVSVYKLIDKEIVNRDLSTIRKSGVLFGPVPVFRYPPSRGKNKWIKIHHTKDFLINKWPLFKTYQGVNKEEKNWSKLDKWRIVDYNSSEVEMNFQDYEKLRHLETTILNSGEGVAMKITMMKLIEEKKKVSEFYDLRLLGNRNIYLQLVNTYYGKEKASSLLDDLSDEVIYDY
jgi:hypothetical protein